MFQIIFPEGQAENEPRLSFVGVLSGIVSLIN